MHASKTLLTALLLSLFLFGTGFSQETFIPKMVVPPVAGTPGPAPDVLSKFPYPLSTDGISIKNALDILNRIPTTERRTRGARDVAIFKTFSSSVVLVHNDDGIGSGIVIADSLILTNWHVVGDHKQIGVTYKRSSDASQLYVSVADVIRIDQVRDLALLRVIDPPSNPPKPIELEKDDNIVVGADVHAIGHPKNLNWSLTNGIISQLRRDYDWGLKRKHRADIIQTQAPISPGSSGGPLLSDDGKLVGVNSFYHETFGSLNFAISVSEVRKFLAATADVPANALKQANNDEIARCSASKPLFVGRTKQDDAYIIKNTLKCDSLDVLTIVVSAGAIIPH